MKAEQPKFNVNVATRLLAAQGLQPTDENLALLASKAKDANKNKRLSEAELMGAMPKLLRAIHRPNIAPELPIKGVLAAPPKSLDRYRFNLVDTNGDRRSDFLAIDPAPLKQRGGGEARVRTMATAKAARSVEIGHTRLGGPTLQFKDGNGDLLNFRNAKWVTASFEQMIATRPDAKAQLKALSQAGYDVRQNRSFLSVNVTGNPDPVLIGLRGPGDKADPAQKRQAGEPAGRSWVGPGFGQQNLPDKSELGMVILCHDVQIEQFGDQNIITIKKPVIYLYPEQKTSVRVQVEPNGAFSAQYPKAHNGTWEMIATPDGTLFDPKTEKRYSYLFWEAKNQGTLRIDEQRAFCVKGEEAADFLEGVSRKFALTDRERTDFVSFWIPALEANKYNVLQFLDQDECAAYAKMSIEPKPDAEIRLFMLFKGSDKLVKTGNPALPELRRGKFTVVEWGGANLDE